MLIHVVCPRETVPAKDRVRIALAEESWANLKGVTQVRAEEHKLPRFFHNGKGMLPFLKDILQIGLDESNAQPDDTLFFTNDDILLHPGLPWALDRYLTHTRRGFCVGARCRLDLPQQWYEVLKGNGDKKIDGGRDLLAFSARWLRSNWDKIPDFVIGSVDWDVHMALMMQVEIGMDITINKKNWDMRRFFGAVEIPTGFVWHISHESPSQIDFHSKKPNAANLHNQKQCIIGARLLGIDENLHA